MLRILIMTLLIALPYQQHVVFTLVNKSSDPITIEVAEIGTILLNQKESREVRFSVGQEIYVSLDLNNDGRAERFLLFKVTEDLEGKDVKIGKLLKEEIKKRKD